LHECCSMLQCVAVCCSVLQYLAAHVARKVPTLKTSISPPHFVPPCFVAYIALELGLHPRTSSCSAYCGMRPPSALLLHGPAGSGKTTLLRHMASLIGSPIISLEVGGWVCAHARVCICLHIRVSVFLSGSHCVFCCRFLSLCLFV